MKQFGLLGYPLSHSLSPQIHSEIGKRAGCPFGYRLYSAPEEALTQNFDKLRKLDGFNVTIPYKTKIIGKLNALHRSAQEYGAVNTVSNENGALMGYNTDVDGFLKSISLLGAPLHKTVLLLGAGGAARVMARETLKCGGTLTVAVRDKTSENARSLQRELQREFPHFVTFCTFGDITGSFDTLLNATPVGMYPEVDRCPMGDNIIQNCSFVFDSIYNPKETVLMKKARAMGKQVLGGMAMLVWQAVRAQQIWNGIALSDEEVNEIIENVQERL